MEPPDGGRNTLAVIVMHRGEVIAERYGAPVTAATPMQGWSMNKSLMATFIGRQVDRGNLNLDGAVVSALRAAGTDARTLGKVNPSLTLRHLLSMTTGFDFSERYFPGDDVTDMLYRQPGMWLSAPIPAMHNRLGSNGPIPVVTSIPLPSSGSSHYLESPTFIGSNGSLLSL